jgi:hypothetical protein
LRQSAFFARYDETGAVSGKVVPGFRAKRAQPGLRVGLDPLTEVGEAMYMGLDNSEPDNSRLDSAKEPGRGYHDLGGLDGGPIDTGVSQAKPWEKLAVVVGNALGTKGAKIVRTDEVRRTREEMGADLYNRLGYFEKGIESLRRLLVEKGVIDQQDLDRRMG